MQAFRFQHSVIMPIEIAPKNNVTERKRSTVCVANTSSFTKSVCFVIRLAQFFALMPVYGIQNERIKFRWLSFKMFYSVFGICGGIITTILYIIHFVYNKDDNFSNIVNIVFFLSSAITGLLFIRLAYYWSDLAKKWEMVEQYMEIWPSPPNLTRRFKIATSVIMTLAFGEHLLSVINNLSKSSKCLSARYDPLKAYFGYAFSHAFVHVTYTPWIAFFMEVFIVLATFAWNFSDLFIILTSSALAVRFKQLNQKINYSKVKSEYFWKKLREDYTRLAMLCRSLDEAISHIVTLSFANNLFFICIQLFHTLKPLNGLIETIYFLCSFGFLLGRTIALSIYCCWINDESKDILPSLFRVPSEQYGIEVSRLIQQVASCPVVITGSNYFAVTRGLCLQVASAIITFELILVQLGPIFIKKNAKDFIFCVP